MYISADALQSGDLGYGLNQLDIQHSSDLYDLGNQFLSPAQGFVNDYAGTLANLSAEQIDAIPQAAADAYAQGYRLGDGGSGSGAPADDPATPPPTPVTGGSGHFTPPPMTQAEWDEAQRRLAAIIAARPEAPPGGSGVYV